MQTEYAYVKSKIEHWKSVKEPYLNLEDIGKWLVPLLYECQKKLEAIDCCAEVTDTSSESWSECDLHGTCLRPSLYNSH